MEDLTPLIDQETLTEEFCNLNGSCYLDHTGSALYATSQVAALAKDLSENLYGNPHSTSLPSALCRDTVDQVRLRILQYFNTTPSAYTVIFTGGATAALKMVAESFDFKGSGDWNENSSVENNCGGEFAYLAENHTSVLGMRNVDNINANNVRIRCVSHGEAFQTLTEKPNTPEASKHSSEQVLLCGNSLFVYSAQCNFSGFKYPLSWVRKVQRGALDKSERSSRWFCLLDAATLVSTDVLDLSACEPDFVCLSFYKMFGLPTGLGALVVRNASAHALAKRYYGGGTVQMALASRPAHVFRPVLHERFEDGTINYQSVLSVRHGLDWHERVGLAPATSAPYCFALARRTYRGLHRLHHSNGRAAVVIYADTAYDDPATQGAIVNFNICRQDGQFVGYMEVLNLANLHGIHLRVGCFCNPGACQRHLRIRDKQYYDNFKAGHVCGDDKDLIDGRPTGSIRVSFGVSSRTSDVDRLLRMICDCFVTQPAVMKELENAEEFADNLRHKNGLVAPKPKPMTKTDSKRVLNNNSNEKSSNLPAMEIITSPTPLISNNSVSGKLCLCEILLYPVKSCGAMRIRGEVGGWPLDDRGLRYDRAWMVVTDAGVPLTQKLEPRLCLVSPTVDTRLQVLSLNFKGHPSCSVPLHPPNDPVSPISLCHTKVCGGVVGGTDCGDSAADWLSSALARPGLRLIRQAADRQTDDTNGGVESGVTLLALSNQAQFLLLNENSVNWLADLLPPHSDCDKATMVDRFRSNFVFRGDCPAFQELQWKRVKIGSVSFNVDGPCGRCQMICIDQKTGKRTKEPLTTLAANTNGRTKFGIYLSYANDMTLAREQHVSIGDTVFPSAAADE